MTTGGSIDQTLDHIDDPRLATLHRTGDPLAEALHHLRMDGMFYCHSELTAPWGLDLPAVPDCLWFHVVTSGECVLIDGVGTRWTLGAGDVALLPHGSGHIAVDGTAVDGTAVDGTAVDGTAVDGTALVGTDVDTPVVFDLPHHYVSRRYAILRHGGGGRQTTVVCGMVQLGHPAARSLLAALPEVIHVDRATTSEAWQWLPAVLQLMAEETKQNRPGGETVVTRLCDVVVIQGLRHWIETDPGARTGWLGALRDPTIGRAMALVHAEPARPWTVGGLAAEVGLSRSAFSASFTALVGQSPKQYITSWRMRLAEDMLQTTSSSILTIASALGYQSEAAFSRAFKRETGAAPSTRRRPVTSILDELLETG